MTTQTTTTDDRELQRSLRRLSALMNKDLPTLTRQSAGRYAVNLARATAPFGFNDGARQSGVNRVTADIHKVFRPIESVSASLEEEQRAQLAWLTNNKGPATVTKYLRSVGLDLQYRRTAPKNLHNQRRSRSTGRVNRRDPSYAVPGERIEKRIQQAAKRVGLAKHGWTQCARRLNTSALRVAPRWVKSNKGKPSSGSVRATRTKHGVIYELTNHVPYVSRLINRQGMQRSAKRELDFLAKEIQRRIRKNW